MSRFSSNYREDDSDDGADDYFASVCHHNNLSRECIQCDVEIEEMGGIDQCLNCGRYKYGKELDRFQVCIKKCVNPNEY